MKCTKCSAEIGDNMAFCGNCGAPAPNINYQNEAEGKKANKKDSKIKRILLSLLVMAVVYTVAHTVTEKAFNQDDTTTSASTSTATEAPSVSSLYTTEKIVSSEYSDIFLSRYIVEPMSIFFGLEEKCFAKVYEEGTVEKMALGCDGDIVKEMYNVVYIPVDGYTDEQKQVIEQEAAQTYGGYENCEFCEVTYNMGEAYYRIDFKFTDLENADNVAVLAQLGFLTESAGMISMEKTRSNLLASGYVEK